MGLGGVRRTTEQRQNPGSRSWRDSRSVQTNRGGTLRRSLPHRFTPHLSSHSLPPPRLWAPLGRSSVRLQPVKELRNSSTKVWDAGRRSATDGLSLTPPRCL